jgi:DNA-binding transcriptional ArsR family regulator
MGTAGAPVVEDAFGVLAHPVRRELLRRLAREESRASDLALRLPVSRSAVSQHLRLMLEVGVVGERKAGRERYYSLRRDRLNEVDEWLTDLDNFWATSLQRLGRHLDGGKS